ncbi:MAG: PD-(D/E)XK nuclease-like domain-containing protein [Clostridia bacterium]|nr:PD-(D/E)XK nuclease-like domain-containing protein [Clostridia bacterium]MBR5264856.1 PD-(D/E)XK nuclease-like domain-containing protein [Clostridia bacterium]
MTEREYRSNPSISRSDLWKMHESPEKFLYYREHPQEPTPALIFGQVVHKLLLQPESFDEEFALLPDVDRRTKEGKAAYSAFLEASVGKTTVGAEMYDTARSMVEKALQVELVRTLLSGKKEVPFFWADDVTGIYCKCRVDCITEIGDQIIIVDYKSCTDASNDSFMKDAVKYGYTLQAAMYSDGVERNKGKRPVFVFIAQEKTEPFSVNIFQADERFVQYGQDIFREYMGLLRYCTDTGDWYGYLGKTGILNTLSLPNWLAKGE